MAIEDNARLLRNNQNLINGACSEAMKAHGSSTKPFVEKSLGSHVIFSFPGTWSVKDWYSKEPFGMTKVNLDLFPSLRSIGNDETAEVNEAFQERFRSTLPKLQERVKTAVSGGMPIVFTGHSSGGPIAALATIWLLENYSKRKIPLPVRLLCLTFGSPLLGSHIIDHALRRENWCSHFFHFVARYDVMPRVFLATLSSLEDRSFPEALEYFRLQPKDGSHARPEPRVASELFYEVISSALTLTSHVACKLTESGNLLVETVASFLQLSTYRPFGNFVLFDSNGGSNKLLVLDNSEAVLQLLFYSCQPSSGEEESEIATRSLKDHLAYGNMSFDSLIDSDDVFDRAAAEFELSPSGNLCLLAAKEAEEQKKKNQEKVDSKKAMIRKALTDIENYRKACEVQRVGYFDSFKLQTSHQDFEANVKRVELVGLWDEIIEMLKSYRLPDEFEGQKEWIELGTRLRRALEPLDIANYYRHAKNEDTGPYMHRARPKRYRYTQRWLEHAEKAEKGTFGESCVWAEIEELRSGGDGIGKKAMEVQRNLLKWREQKVIENDIFLSNSTFVKWWKSLVFPTKLMEIEKFVHG